MRKLSVSLLENMSPGMALGRLIYIAGEKVSLSTLINVLYNFLKEGLC